jgi:hypothetical protein
LEEGSVEVMKRLCVLVEKQQSQAEPGVSDDITGVNCQSLPTIHQYVGDVVPEFVSESPDDLACSEPGIEQERGPVVCLARRVPLFVPGFGARHVSKALAGIKLQCTVEVVENSLETDKTLGAGRATVVKIGNPRKRLAHLLDRPRAVIRWDVAVGMGGSDWNRRSIGTSWVW